VFVGNSSCGTITTQNASAAPNGGTNSFDVLSTNISSSNLVFLQLVSYSGSTPTSITPLLSVGSITDTKFTVTITNYDAFEVVNGIFVISYLII